MTLEIQHNMDKIAATGSVRATRRLNNAGAASAAINIADKIQISGDIKLIADQALARIKNVDSLITKSEDVVLLCGDTGAGKSTLINLLSGVKLQAIRPHNSSKLYLDAEGPSVTRIGHTRVSETEMPSKVVIGDVSYWDCPGFNDSRGPVTDISNAFYINKLLTTSNRIKIIIAADETSINGPNRGAAFKELVSRLGELFENTSDFSKSLCLIFTKVRDIENFRLEIQNIVEEDTNLSHTTKELFSKIISDSKIAIFNLPLKEGVISDTIKNDIMSQIASTDFIEKPNVRITVSKDSLITLSKLINDANIKVGEITQNIVEKVMYKADTLSHEQTQTIKNNMVKIRSSEYSNLQKYLDCITYIQSNIFDPIIAMPNFAEVADGISHNFAELKNLADYFDNFFIKILPYANIDEAKLEMVFLELNKAIDMKLIEYELKDNKEALLKAQKDIIATADSHKQQLQQMSDQHRKEMQDQHNRLSTQISSMSNTISSLRSDAAVTQQKIEDLQKELAQRPLYTPGGGGGGGGGRCTLL